MDEKPPSQQNLRHTELKPRRGLRREEAALYIGVSPSKFDDLVKDRRMPRPKLIDGCKTWDIWKLDIAYDELPEDDGKGNDIDFAV
ncbi:helix-turn-helix transcriptional regulator [Parvibaculum sp.]|uniref:helix-turn-helix domain-containing protein n=1 Tax=Parvibaculum sp. TaxID=2024848 RepID=UPI000C62ED93|nr:helix-turn-helix transcriptional regulator [Parvibaculum sp.]MAM95719.1 hypothetical protein [Parvibaculum sp.]HCX69028.1 hypothetical protein [Rhodobiaceae bacterium]